MREFIASAPGRLDVMGGIADYSGSLVLQLPLDRRTVATTRLHDARTIDITTRRGGKTHHASMALDELLSGAPESLALQFAHEWAAYPIGVAHVLLVRHALRLTRPVQGFSLHLESDVPEGKGVSSSAAVEVASLASLAAAFGADLGAEEIAFASQWAENHVAGAPCGIMDQMTSACGRQDHLMRLRCQPATIEAYVPIPDGYRFFGIDSGIRHAVTGAGYGTVRTAAFMGHRIIADRERMDDRLRGYLANLRPDELARIEADLPETMLGADFLARYQGITDTVTRVDPSVAYPVRVATAHPVRENARVERFAALLGELAHDPDAALEMGELMYESHESYSACGLGSDGTDTLVEMASDHGLFGAKITGGGSGGTVAIFAHASEEPTVRAIARTYERETRRVAEVFAGSGPGLRYGS